MKTFAAVLAAFAVIYFLRAIPFVLMSRCSGDGKWMRMVEKYMSPVVIALLVLYSFSTLEYKTAFPYIAGAVTVALQLAFRNGLVSIFAGTALYMVLIRL